MNSNIDFYNKNADSYFGETINLDMSEWIERFVSYIPEGGRILDAGCGSGRDSKVFISKGFSVVSIDGSKEMCALASKYIGQPVLNICFEELSFESQFDGIWACASLLHILPENLNTILFSLYNSLNENGILYASFKYGNGVMKKSDRCFTNYTEKSLKKTICDAGFKVIEIGISKDLRMKNDPVEWISVICKK